VPLIHRRAIRGARHDTKEHIMKKTIAILAALAAVAAGVSVTASPAAADSPSATYTNGGNPGIVGTRTQTCDTFQTRGVLGAYGAWGYYIDGCTVRVACGSYARWCVARGDSSIGLLMARGDRVTVNSRLRIDDAAGQMTWRRDKSCAGMDSCTVTDEVALQPGQTASVQCNGVREARPGLANEAKMRCAIAVQSF
jgi:hypothetical protein